MAARTGRPSWNRSNCSTRLHRASRQPYEVGARHSSLLDGSRRLRILAVEEKGGGGVDEPGPEALRRPAELVDEQQIEVGVGERGVGVPCLIEGQAQSSVAGNRRDVVALACAAGCVVGGDELTKLGV